jgi:putative phage-type endonuclease
MYRAVQLDVRTNAVLEHALALNSPEQRSAEWHEMRSRYITGSAIDTVLGTNPYETATSLMLIKAGKPNIFTGNAACDHGTLYEQIACMKYEKRWHRRVFHVGLIPHTTHELLAHSPDGLSFDLLGGDPHLLEIKCPTSKKRVQEAIDGVLPPYYYHQIQMGLSVFDLPACDFVQYVPIGVQGVEAEVLSLTNIIRDPDWLAKNDKALRAFWDEVLHWRKAGWENHPVAKANLEKFKCVL